MNVKTKENQRKPNVSFLSVLSVADPGFLVGGCGAFRGGVEPRPGHFLAKMYAKMKEFGPVGARGVGRACARHAPLSSANGYVLPYNI